MKHYSTGQLDHFGLCSSFHVTAPAGEPPKDSEHSGWEFLLSTGTAQRIGIRGSMAHAEDSALLLYNGLERHREFFPADRDTRCMAVVVHPSYANKLLARHGIDADEVVFDSFRLEKNLHLQRLLGEFLRFRKDASTHVVDSLLTEILLHVLTEYSHSHSHRLAELKRSGHFPSTIAQAKRAIAAHLFDENFDLDALAHAVGMSKFHLLRSFKSATGLTPIRYRNELRIEAAKKLLKSTSDEVLAIAISLGYRDLSTFNKSFRKSTASSPTNYRKTAIRS